MEDDNVFLIKDKGETLLSARLEMCLDSQKVANLLRIEYHRGGDSSENLYEYRLEDVEVFFRLITDRSEVSGDERYDVGDQIVLEPDMQKCYEDLEDSTTNLRPAVQWQRMHSVTWGGLKYFIISKKSPTDARRFLRQELERLRVGIDAFLKEAARCGYERDDSEPDRLKRVDGNPPPLEENDMEKLADSAPDFGITYGEYIFGNELCGVLERLLGD